MSRLKTNVSANLVGQAWASGTMLLCLPVYLRLLGPTRFGLVGFYFLLQSILLVFDLGVAPTLNRELARRSVDPGSIEGSRDLLRILEIVYWFAGAFVSLALAAAAPWLGSHWLHGGVPGGEVGRAIRLMSIALAFQWPISLYQGGLWGLEKQIAVNLIKIVMTSVSAGGAVAVMIWVSPTPRAFFLWNSLAAGLYALWLRQTLWRQLRWPAPARLSFEPLREIWRFSAGVSGVAVTAALIAYWDKIVLSRTLDLAAFGFYALASTLSAGLGSVIAPVFNAVFPRLARLIALGESESVSIEYHQATQWMAALVLPLAISMSAFSGALVLGWTGNAATAGIVGPLLSLLVLGTGLNGLTNIPYSLQLAVGWVGIALRINAVLLAGMIPLVLLLVNLYGPIGAAAAWLLINVAFMAVSITVTHQRVLRGEAKRWFVQDILPALLGSVGVALTMKLLLPAAAGRMIGLLEWTATLAISLIVAWSVTQTPREAIRGMGKMAAARIRSRAE